MTRPPAEVDVDVALVRALLASQHPDLAERPVRPAGGGWDNALFRIGDDLVARLPRRAPAAPLVQHEQRWLPVLAPRLPLPVPAPLRRGRAEGSYPWDWSIVPWRAGRALDPSAFPPAPIASNAAARLGRFLRALHVVAPDEAPRNAHRGIPLADRLPRTVAQLAGLDGVVHERHPTLQVRFTALVEAPVHRDRPTWVHGDLHPGNVLVDDDGAVVAVLDFGDLCAGDPATDLALGWMCFDGPARTRFLREAGVHDRATIDRGRGWAIALAVAYLDGAPDDPWFVALAHRTLAAALDEGPDRRPDYQS